MSQHQVFDPFAKTTNLKRYTLAGRDDETLDFVGVLLGRDTSFQDQHTHHPRRHAAKKEKCSACRWFEVAIYQRYTTEGIDLTTDPAHPRIYPLDKPVAEDYVVHTVGASAVPGEQRLSRIAVTESGFEMVELLTVRKLNEEPFITAQSSRALAQAASRDENIRDAYINRAVV